MRVLISGFEPFGGRSVNPTAILIEDVSRGHVQIPQGIEIRTALLPVTFEQAFIALETEFRRFRPDVVLALGQAGGRQEIDFERVAINCIDADIKDNSGHQPRELPISVTGPDAYFSSLPIRQLEEALRAGGIPSKISNSAGTYVCNFVFYRLMELVKGTDVKAGFIHVPFHPSQGEPSLTTETLIQALQIILKHLQSL